MQFDKCNLTTSKNSVNLSLQVEDEKSKDQIKYLTPWQVGSLLIAKLVTYSQHPVITPVDTN